MVGKLFNDLVTTLDILLDSPTINVCVNHPSVCVLKGKVRIIAKRPFIFRSLQLHVLGLSRIIRNQGAKNSNYKQTFLDKTLDFCQNPEQSTSLHQGVNDIDFTIEFPSHVPSKRVQRQPSPVESSLTEGLCCLPTGPVKAVSTDSSISYTVCATLGMSRRDILVNNHVSTTVPFWVQSWQDTIDYRQSDDHSYHGKRRARIEFQFQVPKQLDSRRLGQSLFGINGSWKTLQDHLRVREIQYFLVEEEQQKFAGNSTPHVDTTIISTQVVYDCSQFTPAPTNAWNHLENPERLQILQPLRVLETSQLPFPHSLTISHKLRVLIRFDQTLSKERDLQLSFPVLVHPVLQEDGAPVHQDPTFDRALHRRRIRQALYGNRTVAGEGIEDGEGGYDDEDGFPLPIYADRETTVLLMVGEEIIAQPDIQVEEIEGLGLVLTPHELGSNNERSSHSSDHDGSDEQSMPLHSPVQAHLSSPPLSPVSSILSRTNIFDQQWSLPSDDTPDYSTVSEQGQIPGTLPPPYGYQSYPPSALSV
ncbi:hypothetical protein EMPS_08398 [Entomortierella parvispora]|uniref:Uncharacterized protein n=1 Tax=Entomortierella parvispora TaxID=205924 RepID=A0A9P3HFY1_9FUNG|nr:hypothetical protein EMPS_08398 [Entomortierella parvispora]